MYRRVAVAAMSLALLAAIVPASVSAAKPAGPVLTKEDSARLIEREVAGTDSTTVLIAARKGANRAVVDGITRLGGTIQYRDDDVDYLRAAVPTAKVKAAAALAGVQGFELDRTIPLPDPRPEGAVSPTPQTPPSASTPNINPYMPIGDTGAAQFRAAHPTWDGRGVKVGILDSGVTLDHPSLQTTTTGAPKIIDWVTYTDPSTDNDPTWVPVTAVVTGPSFVVETTTYTAPSAGSFRFGVFNERDARLGGEVGSDVNRDGNPAGSSGLFAVLWKGNKVWGDVRQH